MYTFLLHYKATESERVLWNLGSESACARFSYIFPMVYLLLCIATRGISLWRTEVLNRHVCAFSYISPLFLATTEKTASIQISLIQFHIISILCMRGETISNKCERVNRSVSPHLCGKDTFTGVT